MNKNNRPFRKQHYSSLYFYSSSICIEWGERFLFLKVVTQKAFWFNL